MKTNQLLEQIWNEKRGKIVRSDVSDLGISITIDAADFHWHHVIYGLISLLLSDPEKAYEWSINWGRTVIQVHPRRGFEFKFSSLQSADEKSGVFLSTGKKIQPEEFISPYFNKGRFAIILNSSVPLLLEGAVLQVERMVDELTWCYHRKLLVNDDSGDAVETYRKALQKVWEEGISVRYDSEENILNLKKADPDVPIRIYGNILHSGKVPSVIGVAIIPNNFTDVGVNLSFERANILAELSSRQSKNFRKLPIKQAKHIDPEKAIVCGAVTVGKKMHVGHLLLLTYASLISRAFGEKAEIHLELNDIGERIFGLVATVARELNIPVELAVEKLLNDQDLSIDFIDYCYRKREMDGARYLRASEILNYEQRNLFRRYVESILNTLKRCGFDSIMAVRDSECICSVDNIYLLNTGNLANFGFQFVKYLEKGQERMCILEKGGHPTASTMRTAFLKKASNIKGDDSQMIFVDAGPDVSDAERLMKMSSGVDVHQLEGIGLSFDMKIVSGSNGLGISIDDFYNRASEKFSSIHENAVMNSILFHQMLTFFILTRNMTARSCRSGIISKVDKTGMAFFDYQEKEALVGDFVKSYDELVQFLFNLENAKKKMLERACGDDGGVRHEYLIAKAKKLVRWMKDISCPRSLSQIFLPLKAIQINWPFNLIRNWLNQNCDFSMSWIDDLLIQSSIEGYCELASLTEYLRNSGLSMIADMPPGVVGECKNFIELNFVSSLRARGYPDSQIVIIAREYMQGNYCLVRKRSLYFDTLLKFLSSADLLEHVDSHDANEIVDSVNFCLEKNGFSANLFP